MINRNEMRQFIYEKIVEIGRAPSIEETSAKFDISKQQAQLSYKKLADDHILVLEKDRQIRMALPFSNIKTQYKIVSGDRSWWASCAWDALGIAALTGLDSRLEATCPDCGDPIKIKAENGKLSGDSSVVHFVVPAANWWDDIIYT